VFELWSAFKLLAFQNYIADIIIASKNRNFT